MTLHENFAAALRDSDLNVISVEPVSGNRRSPNPTAVTVQWGAKSLAIYHVFAWNITHEGKGRSGDNWRVQATSFGKGNSPVEVTRATIGLGWHEATGVWIAFDPWVKRSPGTSSSVHITDALLHETKERGKVATTHRDHLWDPRLGFTPEHATEVFPWSNSLWEPKDHELVVLTYTKPTDDQIIAEVDPKDSPGASGVRLEDRVSIHNENGVSLEPYYWRVKGIEIKDIPTDNKRNKIHYLLAADKSATI